ncbi:hypothetical protein DFH07DRAFT_253203 [Mycena maculata]|uniref:F-box domain-containing protein n=1 Tax=Mycena maculata TaxID=230809 RepID=A0AAD7MNA9_9AGAR|nr:hypothetical protein DFH07DRAFT_253203 [Mycena maculata]
MHRGLFIPEIVGLIFAELRRPAQPLVDERNDLAALTRTCKAFQDPALNLLWSEQDTLDNLLRTLPPHLWTDTVDQRAYLHFRLIGPIKPADWEIPLVYALRIRTLSLRMWGSNQFRPAADIFEAISSGLPRDYLCPKLRSISWYTDMDTIFPYIRLFLGPEITEAGMTFPVTSPLSLLPTLPLRYAALTRLHIYVLNPPYSSIVRSTASEIVMQLE